MSQLEAAAGQCATAEKASAERKALVEIIARDEELLATQKTWNRIPEVLTPQAIDRFLSAPTLDDALYERVNP